MGKINFDYANVRLRAMKSYLLTKDQYETLLHQPSVDLVANILSRTRYNQRIQSIYQKNQPAKTLNQAIVFYFRDQMEAVKRTVRQPYSDCVSWLLRYWDVFNIKIAIRTLNSSIPLKERLTFLSACSHCLPIGDLISSDLVDLFKATNVEDLTKLLQVKNSPFYNVLAKINEISLKNREWYVENLLNRFYYSKIISLSKKLSDKSIFNPTSKNSILKLVQEEIDHENIKIALRWIRAYKFEPSSVVSYPPREIFIPGGERFDVHLTSGYLENGNFEKISEILNRSPFSKISISEIYKEIGIQELDYETKLEREFIRYQMNKKYSFSMKLNVLISFYYSLIAELRNLEIIIYGIEGRINPQLLARRLIYG
ncbi:MAG: V-type ATPase subunit [Candidatus Thorarchaeota archaeon]